MAVSKPNIVDLISQIPADHFGNGRGASISQISEHHVYGDAIHAINKAKNLEFSTTFTIGMDGTIYQLVDIKNTPYCDNDYRSNARAITIEHAGGHPNYPYTEAMYQSSINLHAWLFQTYGNLNPIRHRDIPEIKANPAKATACSGGLDVERIVREAKQLLTNGDEEMITKDDVGILRIAHSEVGGWPVHETHNGKFDETFLSAWQGKSVKELLWAQWRDGGSNRDKKYATIAAYPGLVAAVAELQEKLKNAENKPPVEVIREVEKIVEKCTAAVPVAKSPIVPSYAPKVSLLTKILALFLSRKSK